MSRQPLDLGPIRRRWIAGTYTGADVRALLEEVIALRTEKRQLGEQLGQRHAAAALALDGPFIDAERRRAS